MNERIPKVRIARPAGRPFQLRYTCPTQGREIRISIGCRDEATAEREKRELEARLTLGIAPDRRRKEPTGPEMSWDTFRERYRQAELNHQRERSAESAESRLDIAERILKPRTLGDVAKPDALTELQSLLLAGAHSRYGRARSPHTVKSYMTVVIGALNWAESQEWIQRVPKIKKLKTSKRKQAKGRPLHLEEFEGMEMCIGVGLLGLKPSDDEKAKERKREQAAKIPAEILDSWRHVILGLWTSGLRLEEMMHVSWDIPGTIVPVWHRGQLPELLIPAEMQKNDTEESIPLLPWFEELLNSTPADERRGWVFNPKSLQSLRGRQPRQQRPSHEWVGKIISRIGKAAGIIVDQGDASKGKPPKYASAHDLRRSCARRMKDAGVPNDVISTVMRHASWETTKRHYVGDDVQKDAEVLRRLLESPASSPVPTSARYTLTSV